MYVLSVARSGIPSKRAKPPQGIVAVADFVNGRGALSEFTVWINMLSFMKILMQSSFNHRQQIMTKFGELRTV